MITELITGRREISLMHSNLESNIFSARLADQRRFSAYLSHLNVEQNERVCQEAVRFAVEDRHEACGHERLACQLLVKSLSYGIGFNEALEMLLRLEDRADLYRGFSSHLSDACYDCSDDPELQENIDLLKKALLENTERTPASASCGLRLSQ